MFSPVVFRCVYLNSSKSNKNVISRTWLPAQEGNSGIWFKVFWTKETCWLQGISIRGKDFDIWALEVFGPRGLPQSTLMRLEGPITHWRDYVFRYFSGYVLRFLHLATLQPNLNGALSILPQHFMLLTNIERNAVVCNYGRNIFPN